MSVRDKRQIIRLASTGEYSSSRILGEMDLNVCKKTICNVLSSSSNLQYSKMKSAPNLKQVHKDRRLQFAKKTMTWSNEWKSIIFSDEKKFNLDGPDGWAYYWRDLRKEPKIFSKRNFGGGSVMIWGAFSYNGKAEIHFMNGRYKSSDYLRMLENHLLPSADRIAGSDWTFMQDNAAIHVSNESKKWFQDKNIDLLEWPACSPDLNPIENLWSSLARKVYQNNRHFESILELRSTIELEWQQLELSLLRKLIDSMPSRIFEVINKNGGVTSY